MDNKISRFYIKLGINLRKARKAKGLTLQQVSDIMKRGVSTISDNERGITEIPFSVIVEYCLLYGVSIEEITPEL